MKDTVTFMWEFQSIFEHKLIEPTHHLRGEELINIIPFITGPSCKQSWASPGQ